MATLVLVHGGWDGGWAWRGVADLLTAAGHGVFRPSLTGAGERVHLATPDVGLHTHIDDIVNLLVYERLTEVVLVGISYGGMVISGVAERAPERLRQLIYLDAFVPSDGKSTLDLVDPALGQGLVQMAQSYGDGWRIPHSPPDADRRTDMLLKSLQEPLELGNTRAAALPHTYVQFTDKAPGDFTRPLMQQMAARAQVLGWRYHEMPFSHWPLLDKPHELVTLLLELL
jgi:pimeloyl-ACP methyl ester carboxylesterase